MVKLALSCLCIGLTKSLNEFDIKGYINYLGDEEQSKKEELTEEQRIKILANIAYFGEQYKYTDDSPYQMMGRLRYFLSDSQVDILVKNKYFNLPKFKEWWDKADYDEYLFNKDFKK